MHRRQQMGKPMARCRDRVDSGRAEAIVRTAPLLVPASKMVWETAHT